MCSNFLAPGAPTKFSKTYVFAEFSVAVLPKFCKRVGKTCSRNDRSRASGAVPVLEGGKPRSFAPPCGVQLARSLLCLDLGRLGRSAIVTASSLRNAMRRLAGVGCLRRWRRVPKPCAEGQPRTAPPPESRKELSAGVTSVSFFTGSADQSHWSNAPEMLSHALVEAGLHVVPSIIAGLAHFFSAFARLRRVACGPRRAVSGP